MVREKSIRETILGIPLVYQLLQNGIRKPESDTFLAKNIIGCQDGMSILDIGCGVARIRKSLGDVNYVGVDHNPRYITKASQHYRGKGRFFVADVREISELVEIKFDRVLLIGVLHHLDDSSSRNVILQARSVLKQGGRLICYDPTFVQNQHPISYLISRFDRGRFVRKPEEYEKLLCEEFQSREILIRNDLLWLPSATVIISARLEA